MRCKASKTLLSKVVGGRSGFIVEGPYHEVLNPVNSGLFYPVGRSGLRVMVLRLAILQVVESLILGAAFQKRRMGGDINDFTLAENNDLIGIQHGRETVGD